MDALIHPLEGKVQIPDSRRDLLLDVRRHKVVGNDLLVRADLLLGHDRRRDGGRDDRNRQRCGGCR